MKLRAVFSCAVLSGSILSGISETSVFAFPPIPGQIKEAFKDDKDYKPFLDTVEALKSKCDVCHKPGADKKGRGHGLNDFGKVYGDLIKAGMLPSKNE